MNRIDLLTVNTIRTLAADAVEKAKSGHPGMAIGAAPIALAVFEHMKMCRNSYSDMYSYLRRDRFILSSGHASMLEYAMLHLFGYDVTIDDIKSFRQMGSKTAGHPEYRSIWGIEATTGPLGQGFAMAVGMAMAEKHMAAVYNRPGFPIFDNYTFTLMGDGCMMEGITGEAASIAGNLKLNKLIAIYDSNRITIEGSTDITFTENVEMRYKAYGWGVIKVMDLGLCQSTAALRRPERQDEVVGTPAYISPEQIYGDVPLDCRADIYCLGATLYHLVTGHILFPLRSNDDILRRHVDPAARAPDPRTFTPAVSEQFARLLAGMLVKDRAGRYQTWDDVYAAARIVDAGQIDLPPLPADCASSVAVGTSVDRR